MVTANLSSGLSGDFVPGTIGGTRLVAVSPVLLQSGAPYYILANNFLSDVFAYGTGAVTHTPQITWNGFVDGLGLSIHSTPLFFGGVPGNTGPNFAFVPEPSALVLCAAALLVFERRRRSITDQTTA